MGGVKLNLAAGRLETLGANGVVRWEESNVLEWGRASISQWAP